MTCKITLIPGDGTGPELTEATRRVIEATGVPLEWEVMHAGADVIEQHGTPLPEAVLDSIRRNRVALKGPITTPIGTGFRSVNVALRKLLELYVCLRPARSYAGIPSPYSDIDIIIVRENTEDLYAGIEFERGSKDAMAFKDWLDAHGAATPENSGYSVKPISEAGSRRIVRFAFDYARARGRRRVTAVHKANIMKFSDGLFLEVAREVAAENSDIAFDDRLVDNLAMQLVKRPSQFDVLVLPNLYGDIISDLCAGLVGGLGMTPGANIGDDIAVFEPTHGSAPKYRGQNKVNPFAMMLSGVLMLKHLGEAERADRLEQAIAAVIAEGKSLTYDLLPAGSTVSPVGTSEVADAVIAAMK